MDQFDFFSRQRAVPDWDNEKILAQVGLLKRCESNIQTALVLGVGGIGSTISLALCRLGLRKIILLDNDIVQDR